MNEVEGEDRNVHNFKLNNFKLFSFRPTKWISRGSPQMKLSLRVQCTMTHVVHGVPNMRSIIEFSGFHILK